MDLTERLQQYAAFLDTKIKEEEDISKGESFNGSIVADERKLVYVLAKQKLYTLFPELSPQPNVYAEALKLVDPCYHDAFLKFVEKGETTPAFSNYLDNHPQAQKAVDIAFHTQTKSFEDLIRTLKTPDKKF